MKTTQSALAAIKSTLVTVYGTTLEQCDAIAVEWAADRLAAMYSVEFAAKAMRLANARRHKLGLYTTIPAYGSQLRAAYFAK